MPEEDNLLLAKITNSLCLAMMYDNDELINQAFLTLEKYSKKQVDQNKLFKKTLAGYSAIYYAVKMGNIKAVNRLISLGADVHEEYDGLSLRNLVQQEIIMGGDTNKYNQIERLLQEKQVVINQHKIEAFRKQFNRLGKRAKKYAQFKIKDIMSKKNYELFRGYCRGMSWMGAQAFLLEDRDADNNLVHLDHFAKRAQYVWKNYSNLHQQMDRSDHKRKLLVELAKINNQPISTTVHDGLSPNDRMNLEVDPFLNGINLFQMMSKYKGLSVVKAAKLVPNIELEEKHGCVVIADRFNYQANKQGFVGILKQVEAFANSNNYSFPVVLELGANGHSIVIGYDPVNKHWRNIDINDVDNISKKYTADDIASLAREALFIKNDSKKTTVEISLLSTARRANEINTKIVQPLKLLYMPKRFISRHKEKFKTAGVVLLGAVILAGLIAGTILSGGSLPIVIASAGLGICCLGGEGYFLTSKYYDYKENKLIKKHRIESVEEYNRRSKDKPPYNTAGIMHSSANFEEKKDEANEEDQVPALDTEVTEPQTRSRQPAVMRRGASNQKMFAQSQSEEKSAIPQPESKSTWGKCCGFLGQIFK